MKAHFKAGPDRRFTGPATDVACSVGKGGMRPAADKSESDGASPIGIWDMRRVYWRPDRLDRPVTGLPTIALTPEDGWCDAPGDPLYNRPVCLPYPASHEKLWREDHVYDVIVELSHNQDPVVPGKGSAIFLHVARPGYEDTEGCIALALKDLLAVLEACEPGAVLEITG